MNRLFLFIYILFCAAPAGAQKAALKAAAKAASKYAPVRAEFIRSPGRVYKVDFFERVWDWADEPVFNAVYGRAMENNRLESLVFGRVRAAQDARNHFFTRLGWQAHREWFGRNEEVVRASLSARLYGSAPAAYEDMLDFSSRIVFLGEEHGVCAIMAEVAGLVENYARLHPRTPVYLATEFLHTRAADGTPSFVLDRAALEAYRPDLDAEEWMYFSGLAAQGIRLVGLEEWTEFQAETGRALTQGELSPCGAAWRAKEYELARSLYGIELRNRAWAKRLRRLRAHAGPEAVIFVYTGSFHVNRSVPLNLPELLGEKAAPVITFASFTADAPDFFLWDGHLRLSGRYVLEVPPAPDMGPVPAKLVQWTDNPAFARRLGSNARVWFF